MTRAEAFKFKSSERAERRKEASIVILFQNLSMLVFTIRVVDCFTCFHALLIQFYMKLEEKMHAKEVEMNQKQAVSEVVLFTE